jgi:hypothetical protein
VIAGLASWALYVNQAGSERHSYSRGANPPTYVRLVAGNSYSIAIHGGVDREVQLGVDPSTLLCTAALPNQSPGALDVVTEQQDSKATDRIATFVSAISGSVQIQCNGIGAVYVDDAADAPFDVSGVWLVLASLALLIGLPLTLSGLRRPTVAPSALPDADDVSRVDPAAEGVL